MQQRERAQLRKVELRRVAVDAEVDERTLQRFLRHEPVRDSSAWRIERALRARGLNVDTDDDGGADD
jgi:hypothetical protein